MASITVRFDRMASRIIFEAWSGRRRRVLSSRAPANGLSEADIDALVDQIHRQIAVNQFIRAMRKSATPL